jgi:hypothetical protein
VNRLSGTVSRRDVLRSLAAAGLLAASAGTLSACGTGRHGLAADSAADSAANSAGAASAAASGPVPVPTPGTVVMIIRHGEKPDGSHKGIGPDGQKDKAALTEAGHARADRLVGLFDPAPGALRPGLVRPSALYAANATTGGEGERTRETLAPLAARLGIPVNTTFGKGQESALVAQVLARPAPTLICWQHGEIPAIVAAFGHLSPTPPYKWPGKRFDMVWTLTASATGWTFAQVPELVMPSDRTTVIAD